MPIDAKKIALVQVARARLRLDEEVYRATLRRYGGVDSSAELDPDGFDLVMEHFAQLGFRSDFRKRNLGGRPGMATAGQVALIRGLWDEYTDGQGTELSLGKWLHRVFKVSALRFLDRTAANKAIHALRAMKAKRQAGTKGAA